MSYLAEVQTVLLMSIQVKIMLKPINSQWVDFNLLL